MASLGFQFHFPLKFKRANTFKIDVEGDFGNNNISSVTPSASAFGCITQNGYNVTDALTDIFAPENGTITKVGVNITVNTLDGTATLILRRNGADSVTLLTITGGATGYFSSSPNATFLKNEKINYILRRGTSTVGAVTFSTTSHLVIQ